MNESAIREPGKHPGWSRTVALRWALLLGLGALVLSTFQLVVYPPDAYGYETATPFLGAAYLILVPLGTLLQADRRRLRRGLVALGWIAAAGYLALASTTLAGLV